MKFNHILMEALDPDKQAEYEKRIKEILTGSSSPKPEVKKSTLSISEEELEKKVHALLGKSSKAPQSPAPTPVSTSSSTSSSVDQNKLRSEIEKILGSTSAPSALAPRKKKERWMADSSSTKENSYQYIAVNCFLSWYLPEHLRSYFVKDGVLQEIEIADKVNVLRRNIWQRIKDLIAGSKSDVIPSLASKARQIDPKNLASTYVSKYSIEELDTKFCQLIMDPENELGQEILKAVGKSAQADIKIVGYHRIYKKEDGAKKSETILLRSTRGLIRAIKEITGLLPQISREEFALLDKKTDIAPMVKEPKTVESPDPKVAVAPKTATAKDEEIPPVETEPGEDELKVLRGRSEQIEKNKELVTQFLVRLITKYRKEGHLRFDDTFNSNLNRAFRGKQAGTREAPQISSEYPQDYSVVEKLFLVAASTINDGLAFMFADICVRGILELCYLNYTDGIGIVPHTDYKGRKYEQIDFDQILSFVPKDKEQIFKTIKKQMDLMGLYLLPKIIENRQSLWIDATVQAFKNHGFENDNKMTPQETEKKVREFENEMSFFHRMMTQKPSLIEPESAVGKSRKTLIGKEVSIYSFSPKMRSILDEVQGTIENSFKIERESKEGKSSDIDEFTQTLLDNIINRRDLLKSFYISCPELIEKIQKKNPELVRQWEEEVKKASVAPVAPISPVKSKPKDAKSRFKSQFTDLTKKKTPTLPEQIKGLGESFKSFFKRGLSG